MSLYYIEYKRPIPNISSAPSKLYYQDGARGTGLLYDMYWDWYPVGSGHTSSIDWVIANPVADSTIGGIRLQNNAIVTGCYSYLIGGGKLDVNIYYGSVGSTTTLLSGNLSVSSTESSTTGFVTTTLTSGTWLSLHFGALDKGTPSQITVTLFVLYPQS